MLAFEDDKTIPSSFGPTTITHSLTLLEFDSANSKGMTLGSPYQGTDYFGNTVNYTHKVDFSVAELGISGDIIWLRCRTDDTVNPSVDLPASDALFKVKTYFSLKIN
jgi:hypothetical protein